MLTQLTPVNRLSARMGNRILEFEPAMQVPVETDAEMQQMLAGLAPQLSATKIKRIPGFFSSRTETMRMTKADFFQEFPTKFQELASMYAAVCDWMPEIIRANIEYRNVKTDPLNAGAIAAALVKDLPVK